MNGSNCYQGNNGGINGDYVDYPDIASRTDGETFFAWIWTCKSAQNWPYTTGMPSAWTDTAGMSDDGYADPDAYGSHCYIGFSGASPTLGNTTGGNFKNYTGLGMDFIIQFYNYTLNEGYTIREALNLASSDVFSKSYDESPLYTGYETWWPVNFGPGMGKGWYSGHMRVYGNGNLRLTICSLKVLAAEWTGTWDIADADVWIDGAYAGNTGYMYVVKDVAPGNHTVEVDLWTTSGSGFRHFDDYPLYENPITVYCSSNWETDVMAYYYDELSLSVSAGAGGTTNASGTYYYAPTETAYVTATADGDHIFDHWLLDGDPAGTNPTIGVYMDEDYTLRAVFRDKQHSLTVLAYDQYQQGAVPYYVDDEYMGLTDGYSITVSDGNHKIEVDTPLYDYPYIHVFCYYEVFYGPTYYDNPVTLSITDDETIIAWYYTDYY